MVKSTCFQHTSSDPDKYNNSVNRIISKEEEREDPRRDTSVFFEYSGISTYNPSYKILFEYSVFYSVSTRNPATPSNSAYRINSSTRNTTTTRLIPCHPVQISTRHLPATVPVSPNILHGRIRLPAPYSTSRLPVILPGRNSILSSSQHPRNPYRSSQAHSYRILPGEIGFFPKGLSIVCPCNTKVSVFQFTILALRIILQEI